MAEESVLSIEETNKIRISLGLKPLKLETETAPGAEAPLPDEDDNSVEAQERRAYENWKKLQEEEEKKAKRQKLKEEIAKEKNAMKRFQVLEGKGLADEDDGEEDALNWVKKQKKRQKKLAQKMAEELAARDDTLAQEYTPDQLKDLRVAHDLQDIVEGGDGAILTLKDATIDELEEEGDELEDIALAEKERREERLQLGKKKPGYNVHEQEDETGKKSILFQYDEEIEGKKKKRFNLGEALSLEEREQQRKELGEAAKLKIVKLDMPKAELLADYIDPSEVKIKKVKKKKSKSTRRKRDDDDEGLFPAPEPEAETADPDSMQVDGAPIPAAPKTQKRTFQDVSLVDDDELQMALAQQRRTAVKKRKVMKPADLARQIKEEEETTPMVEDNAEEDGGLVIDETSEFVSRLRAPEEPVVKVKQQSVTAMETTPEPDEDVEMKEESPEPGIKKEETEEKGDITTTGLEEEATLTRGIGATLSMLKQRGFLESSEEIQKANALHRDREKFKLDKRMRQLEIEKAAKAQRERDRQSGKFDRMSAREREEHARWENKQRDQQEARELAAKFKDYKPDVKLVYKDEFGRDLSQKEAFKHLSHQFHGKGSGKAKTEKRLKKIEDEKKREAMSSLTSTQGLSTSMAATAKKAKQAGVRLM